MIDETIRARLQDEIGRQNREMKELSIASGLGDTYVRDALKRGRGKIENLILVARELGKTAEWLVGDETGAKDVAVRPQNTVPANASGRTPAPAYGPPLDVLGVSRGGSDGKLIFNGEVIETIPRPPELEGIDGAYSSYVLGDSMRPRFKEGDRVWVHPHRPPRRGNDVVVQIIGDNEADPPEGYIKEFVGFSGKFLVLTQHNPIEEIKFERDRVKSVHVIVGTLFA